MCLTPNCGTLLSGASETNSVVEVDKFWLKKVVIGVTKQGKIFALDSKNGSILWQKMFVGKGTALHIKSDGSTFNDLVQVGLVNKHARSTF